MAHGLHGSVAYDVSSSSESEADVLRQGREDLLFDFMYPLRCGWHFTSLVLPGLVVVARANSPDGPNGLLRSGGDGGDPRARPFDVSHRDRR